MTDCSTRGSRAVALHLSSDSRRVQTFVRLLNNVLLLRGQIEAAIAAYRSAVELAPEELGYRLNLAYTYRQKGDEEAARQEMEVYRKLTTQIPPP